MQTSGKPLRRQSKIKNKKQLSRNIKRKHYKGGRFQNLQNQTWTLKNMLEFRDLWKMPRILTDVQMLLLLSHFSHVQLCATPQTSAHQAPPSLGFSRQEHWSGLPFPSPMHETEKWKWSRSVMPHSLWPHELKPTRLLYPWDFPGKSTRVGCHCCTNDSLKMGGRGQIEGRLKK